VLALLSALLLAAPAFSHHSAAVFYQLDKKVTVSGIVTEFRMGNPHARIYFDMSNEAGETRQWMAEGGSRTVLLRTGWSDDMIKPGDRVEIIGNPSRDGSNIVHWQEVVLPDGRKLFGEDLNPENINRLLEERRRRE
jgi:hypothetical protein